MEENLGHAIEIEIEGDALPPSSSSSVPPKLKRWYSHTTFKTITLASLSIISILLTFVGLFMHLISACETIGFITAIIMLYAPSPLAH